MRTREAGHDTRGFLKRAGIGVALAVTLGLPLAASAQAASPAAMSYSYGFRFQSLSAPVVVSTVTPAPSAAAPGPTNLLGMNGDGRVTVQSDPMGTLVTDGEVHAIGSFNHWDTDPAQKVKPLIAYGTWKADKLVSLKMLGTYGAWASGTIIMDVTLTPAVGEPVSGQLTVNCNIPPAGQMTGLLEGFYLTIADMSFEPNGSGLTIFTTMEQ